MNLCHDNYDWKQLPIPDVQPEKQAPILALVERIPAAKKSPVGFDFAQPTKPAQPTATRSLRCRVSGVEPGAEGDIPALEAEIDRLVYALYGLTEEEIAVVERKK